MTFRTNAIFCGDCQRILPNHIPEKTIDLIFLDPPYYSNKPHEAFWGDSFERRAFEDRWKGGIENYLSWMEPKLSACHQVLKDTGSMFLQCDTHANAYLRVMMDGIFNRSNFKNEIVWKRSKNRSSMSKIFRRAHDTLLFYTKTKNYTFNMQYRELSEASKKLYDKEDEHGHYQLVPLLVSGKRGGETGKPWKGMDPNVRGRAGMHWLTKPSKLEKYEQEGLIVWLKDGEGTPRLKYYLETNKGVPLSDIWDDVEPISSSSRETKGYPTQKPSALLERIIKNSSNPGDIVLDPMCGCGTAIETAYKLKRKYIGIDISPTACKVMLRSMHKIDSAIPYNVKDIIGMPKTVAQIKELLPFEFQNFICEAMSARPSAKLSGDEGVDGHIIMTGTPLQVKKSEHVGRNVVDNFETAIKRKKRADGIIVAYSFTKDAYGEVARAKREENLSIELRTLDQVLADADDLLADEEE